MKGGMYVSDQDHERWLMSALCVNIEVIFYID